MRFYQASNTDEEEKYLNRMVALAPSVEEHDEAWDK